MEEIQQEEKKHNGNDIFHIKEKIYEMILYGNPQLKDFPKTERYVLAGDIRKTMYTMLEMAVRLEKKYHKKTTLQDLDIEVDVLRNLLRLAKDPNLYPNQKPCLKIKRNLKNQIAKVKAGEERKDRLDRSVASYRGILSHFNSYGLRQSLNTLFKENGMVEKKEEVSRCTGNCNNCPNYTESYFCGFATPYCKLQGKEITHNVY